MSKMTDQEIYMRQEKNSTAPATGQAERWEVADNYCGAARLLSSGGFLHVTRITDTIAHKLANAHNASIDRLSPAGDSRTGSAGVDSLARRAYPNLKYSGLCSCHREDGNFECLTCYPDLNELLNAHMEVSNKLYDELLALSGLSNPPNGRIGTNNIIAKIRSIISAAAPSDKLPSKEKSAAVSVEDWIKKNENWLTRNDVHTVRQFAQEVAAGGTTAETVSDSGEWDRKDRALQEQADIIARLHRELAAARKSSTTAEDTAK